MCRPGSLIGLPTRRAGFRPGAGFVGFRAAGTRSLLRLSASLSLLRMLLYRCRHLVGGGDRLCSVETDGASTTRSRQPPTRAGRNSRPRS